MIYFQEKDLTAKWFSKIKKNKPYKILSEIKTEKYLYDSLYEYIFQTFSK